MGKIVYIEQQIKVLNSHEYHKAVAQYESSGKVGFSVVSQAGIVDSLPFPLHTSVPFKQDDASVFQSVSASKHTMLVG